METKHNRRGFFARAMGAITGLAVAPKVAKEAWEYIQVPSKNTAFDGGAFIKTGFNCGTGNPFNPQEYISPEQFEFKIKPGALNSIITQERRLLDLKLQEIEYVTSIRGPHKKWNKWYRADGFQYKFNPSRLPA